MSKVTQPIINQPDECRAGIPMGYVRLKGSVIKHRLLKVGTKLLNIFPQSWVPLLKKKKKCLAHVTGIQKSAHRHPRHTGYSVAMKKG